MFENQAAAVAAAAAIEMFHNGTSGNTNFRTSNSPITNNNNPASSVLSAAITADKDVNDFMPQMLANVSSTVANFPTITNNVVPSSISNVRSTTNSTSTAAALNVIFDPTAHFGTASMPSFNTGAWNSSWYHNFGNDTSSAAAALLSCSGISSYGASGLCSTQANTSISASPTATSSAYNPYLAQFSG